MAAEPKTAGKKRKENEKIWLKVLFAHHPFGPGAETGPLECLRHIKDKEEYLYIDYKSNEKGLKSHKFPFSLFPNGNSWTITFQFIGSIIKNLPHSLVNIIVLLKEQYSQWTAL